MRPETLQTFQQRLSAKIQAAQAQTSVELLRLHVQVHGRSLLLALPETNQVIEPGKVTPIPLTHPWFSGLTSVRGELTGVVDLGMWLGWGAMPASGKQRWVVMAASLGTPCAIAVDAVLGLVNVSAGAWQAVAQDDPEIGGHLPWLAHERSFGVGALCWGGVHRQQEVTQTGANLDPHAHSDVRALACDFSLSKLAQLAAFLGTERRPGA